MRRAIIQSAPDQKKQMRLQHNNAKFAFHGTKNHPCKVSAKLLPGSQTAFNLWLIFRQSGLISQLKS